MCKKAKNDKNLKKLKKDSDSFINEFRAFISRGNVLDMAIGVIIGAAFSAIVAALVNILLSVCTWGVPGGIAGLVTVLPPAFGNPAQIGIVELGGLQSFQSSSMDEMVAKYMAYRPDTTYTNALAAIKGQYTLHGGLYVYNGAAIIDWGALINAVISFLIVAFTLFLIAKIYKYLKTKRLELAAKALEAYYEKHPEERPVVEPEAPKEPSDHEILKEMLEVMKSQKEEKK